MFCFGYGLENPDSPSKTVNSFRGDFPLLLAQVAVANSELAETSQIIRHPDEPPMHHDGGIFRQP
jgi:hypothetical protein